MTVCFVCGHRDDPSDYLGGLASFGADGVLLCFTCIPSDPDVIGPDTSRGGVVARVLRYKFDVDYGADEVGELLDDIFARLVLCVTPVVPPPTGESK